MPLPEGLLITAREGKDRMGEDEDDLSAVADCLQVCMVFSVHDSRDVTLSRVTF